MPEPRPESQRAPHQILDLSGVGIFPKAGAPPPSSEAVDLGHLVPVSLEHASHRPVSQDGMVDLCLRFTPSEVALIEAALSDPSRRLADGANTSAEDPLAGIGAKVLEALRSGNTYQLTADDRGSAYDCLSMYFDSFLGNDLDGVTAAASSLPQLEAQCRASICIPVAAHEEERFIYRALRAFARQNVDPRTFEIVLYLNHPNERKDGTPIRPDGTISEVVRFCEDYPEVRVRSFYSALEPAHARIGLIRKFLNDVVAMRQYWRGPEAPEHILIRADADTHGVKPGYIANYLRLFDKHPHVDAFKGKLDWDWPSYLKDPALLFGTRLFMALDAYIDATTGNVGGGGANFAIRTGRYADLGGYDAQSGMAEDVGLGVALKNLRAGAERHVAIRSAGAPSILYTDSRRSWAALKKGHAPVCQWHNGDTDFGSDNSDIRSVPQAAPDQTFEELLVAPEFHDRVQTLIQQTFDFYTLRTDPKRFEYIERVLPALGVVATQGVGGEIQVADICGLIRRLVNFHDFAPEHWTGKLGLEP